MCVLFLYSIFNVSCRLTLEEKHTQYRRPQRLLNYISVEDLVTNYDYEFQRFTYV